MSPPADGEAHARGDLDARLARYLRRHSDRLQPEPDPEPDTPSRPRKRVQRAPPDFKAETRAALRYARQVSRLWRPEVVDLKRLAGGAVAYLIGDENGREVAVVVDRGTVERWMDGDSFRDLEEVLR